jgi:hypothetical protein
LTKREIEVSPFTKPNHEEVTWAAFVRSGRFKDIAAPAAETGFLQNTELRRKSLLKRGLSFLTPNAPTVERYGPRKITLPVSQKIVITSDKHCEWRVKSDNNLKQIDKGHSRRKIGRQAEEAIESKKDRHERSGIFPDHLHFLISLVDVSYPHVVEGPQGGQEQGDDHGDPCDSQETFGFKLPRWEELIRLGRFPRDHLEDSKESRFKEEANANALKRPHHPMFQGKDLPLLPFPNLNEGLSSLGDNHTINRKQHIERQAEEKGESKKTEKCLGDDFPSAQRGSIVQ